ncbi:MAG: PEP-CTERM sorting domain-containing protein [Chthoniobacterales bacterium]
MANSAVFYTVDLTTGRLTPVGAIGGNLQLLGLSAVVVPEPATVMLLLVSLGLWVLQGHFRPARRRASRG